MAERTGSVRRRARQQRRAAQGAALPLPAESTPPSYRPDTIQGSSPVPQGEPARQEPAADEGVAAGTGLAAQEAPFEEAAAHVAAPHFATRPPEAPREDVPRHPDPQPADDAPEVVAASKPGAPDEAAAIPIAARQRLAAALTPVASAPRGVLVAGLGVVVIVAAAWLVSSGATGSRSASALGSATTPDSAGRPGVLVQEAFDTKPIASDPAWEIAGAGPDAGTITVAPVPTSVDRSVRVRLAAAGETYTACQAFSAVGRGVLLAEAVVLVDGFGRGATTVASVRSGGNEVAGLRIGPGGEVQVRTEDARAAVTALMPGVWYGVLFELDVVAQTYRLAVSRHGQQAAPVSEQTNVRWSGALAGGLDRFCVAPPSGVADRSIYVSDLRVTSR